MGIVYVLTNEAMPGLVKIGLTDEADANTRIGQLFTTGVPFPFRLEYACKVENHRQVEEALHVAFAPHRINPRREFFRMDPEQAIAILRLLDQRDATAEVAQQPTEVDAVSLNAAEQARVRRPNLNLQEMGVPVGSQLQSVTRDDVHLIVNGPKKVEFEGEELSLSAATQRVLGTEYPVRPTPHWYYQGRLLSDLYEATYGPADGA